MSQATREPFAYLVCAGCGSVRIERIPDDIGRYYQGYFSLMPGQDQPVGASVKTKRALARVLRPFFSKLVLKLARPLTRTPPRRSWGFLSPNLQAFLHACPGQRDRILDVGCGNGSFPANLRRLGFRNVFGIDPFIEESVLGPNATFVRHADIGEMEGRWDLVTFNHSLEHMPDPRRALVAARKLVTRPHRARPGRILVHIPDVASPEFRRFGGDWWGLHAPRHFTLPSAKGMSFLCAEIGLAIVEEIQTSRMDNYLYSSEYAEGLADHDPGGWRYGGPACRWTAHEIRAATRTALRLNAEGGADWICYTLRPAPPAPLTRPPGYASVVERAGERE
jgi:SAM-dependent methyltransferase